MWMKQIGPNIFTEFSPDEMFFCVFTVVAGLAWFLSIADRHEYVKFKCFITDYSHIKDNLKTSVAWSLVRCQLKYSSMAQS